MFNYLNDCMTTIKVEELQNLTFEEEKVMLYDSIESFESSLKHFGVLSNNSSGNSQKVYFQAINLSLFYGNMDYVDSDTVTDSLLSLEKKELLTKPLKLLIQYIWRPMLPFMV